MGPHRPESISSKATFAELAASGRRGGSRVLRLRFVASAPGDDARRVAYAVPRRCGPAVVRNRIRRRVRAAVAQVVDEMAPGAYLIAPDPAARDTPFDELVHSLRACLAAAGATWKEPGD